MPFRRYAVSHLVSDSVETQAGSFVGMNTKQPSEKQPRILVRRSTTQLIHSKHLHPSPNKLTNGLSLENIS